jgi:hypothetical protein
MPTPQLLATAEPDHRRGRSHPNTQRRLTRVAALLGLSVLIIGHGAEITHGQPATSTPHLAGHTSTATADSVPPRIVPAVDVPVAQASDGHVGGQASRIEFDDGGLNASMSVWYRLAYVGGGSRLRVYDHYAVTTQPSDPVMIRSERIAWWIANEILGRHHSAYPDDQLPSWARVHTGIDTGPSAGLIFALAHLDALTPGALVGNLRVAGTGMVGLDGVVGTVTEIEVKVAAAVLTRPDVIFTPRPPKTVHDVTVIESRNSRHPTAGYTTGEWLNVARFEQAGRIAATHPGTVAVVVVNDLRQALAWLCGRTNSATACQLARSSANLPIGT